MRRTKIIATLGPSTDGIEIEVCNKVDAVRLNMAHGSFEEHKARIEALRECSKSIGIMVDIPGPQIRIEKEIRVERGVPIKKLPTSPRIDFEPGDILLIDDGAFLLEVTDFGYIPNRSGLIRKGAKVVPKIKDPGIDILTEKDKKAIKFGVDNEVDFIAVSFVRSSGDILRVREFLEEIGGDQWIIAKIEHRKALEDLEAIVRASDGVMVARGDLALTLSIEEVPIVQKKILKLTNRLSKPGIVATQMLASMVENPFPTRAEVSDIINAVIDGASALMLTNETAIGKYPLLTLEMLEKSIMVAEREGFYFIPEISNPQEIIAKAAVDLARISGAKAIVVETNSGRSALMVSKYRPSVPIAPITSNKVKRKLSIAWGVIDIFPRGLIVRVTKTLGSSNMLEINFEGTVLASGSAYGWGEIRGVVGKDILCTDSLEWRGDFKAILYFGRKRKLAASKAAVENVPILFVTKRIPEGTKVKINFDFGVVLAEE